MKEILKTVAVILLLGLLAYCATSFAAWDINPGHWTEYGRGVALAIWYVFSGIYLALKTSE